LEKLDKEFESLRSYNWQVFFHTKIHHNLKPADMVPLLCAAEGFKIETGNTEAFGIDPRNFMVDQEDNDIPFYKLHFLGKGKEISGINSYK
jgi:hypothetical protein